MPIDQSIEFEADADDDPQSVPTINVYGDFVGRVATISDTMMCLLAGIGRLADAQNTQVLVPYVEMKLNGEDPDGNLPVSTIVTFDNAAFVLADWAGDYRLACQQLGSLASGSLRLEPARLEQAAEYARSAREQIDGCIEEMERMLKTTAPK